MSQLLLSSRTKGFRMNVLAFNSPVYGSISDAQVRDQSIHFPTKISQPEIQFDVMFRGEKEYEAFQRFVRNHQKQLLVTTSLLTLSWPEKNINNWTGVIKSFKGGGMRFNVAPRARFVVELVDSMVSRRTDFASVSTGWRSIYGEFGPIGGVLTPPTLAEAQTNAIAFGGGQDIFNGGITPPGVSSPNTTTPLAPTPPADGILPGTS